MTTLKRSTIRRVLDLVIVVGVCAGSSVLGVRFLAERQLNTYGESLQVAARLACGDGFTVSTESSPQFSAFALRKTQSLSCAELESGAPSRPAGALASGYRYAIYAIAAVIRLGGLSWTTLDAYLGVLFGVSMALAYALFRLGVSPFLAVCGVAALVYSNHIMALGVDVRDYGKEPWFIALWLALGWLIRRSRPHAGAAMYLPAAAGGALLGIGLGFRVDLMICLPAFVAVIAIAARGWTARALRVKGTALGLFVAAFALTGAPILTTLARGSNSSHVVILGLTVPFTQALGITSPVYDVGDLYADGYVVALVSAHATLVQHETEPGVLGSARYDEQGVKLLLDLARRFPADVAVRAIGATRQILSYPFDKTSSDETTALELNSSSSVVQALMESRVQLGEWLDGHMLVLAALTFMAVAVFDWQLALAGALLAFYFCGYSMLQFSRRHTFHLDVIGIGLVVVAASLAASAARWMVRKDGGGVRWSAAGVKGAVRRLGAAMALGVGLAVISTLVVVALQRWQQRSVTELLTRTLAVRWTEVPTRSEPLAQTILSEGRATPAWRVIYGANRDRWGSAVLLRVAPVEPLSAQRLDKLFRAEYLLVEIGGDACGARPVPVALKYTSAYQRVDFEYTRTFDVPVEAQSGTSRLLVPILWWSGVSRFDGIAVPNDRVGCIRRVARAEAARDVPLPVLFAVLPPSWRSTSLFQRLTVAPAPGLDTPAVAALPWPGSASSFGDALPRLREEAPDLGKWIAMDGVSISQADSDYMVQGNGTRFGYQMMSPLIAVTPHRVMRIRVQGRVEAGGVCVGVLEGSQQHFLLLPGPHKREYRVETGPNTNVRIVFANCNESNTNIPSRFSVQSVSYQVGRFGWMTW